MAGVVPGDLKRLFAAVRAASSRGPAKARLFVEDMVQVGEDVYARRNHRLTQIMQLPMQDRSRAVYAFLRGDTPFCPPAGRVLQRPPWNPFAGLPGDLRATFRRALLHAPLVSRSCIEHDETLSLFPHWMAAVAQAFDQWIGSWVARDITTFREWSRVVSAHSWAQVRGTKVRSPEGQSDPWLQVYAAIQLWGTSWAGLARCCRSFSNLCAVSQSWRWLSYLTWVHCGCMTGSCDEPYQRSRSSGPWQC